MADTSPRTPRRTAQRLEAAARERTPSELPVQLIRFATAVLRAEGRIRRIDRQWLDLHLRPPLPPP